MIAAGPTDTEHGKAGRLLVITPRAGDRAWADELRRRYVDRNVITCDTFLSAIAEAARSHLEAVFAPVDGSMHRLDCVVAGMREAVGTETKLLLCCTPESEPVARKALSAGADDYLLYPFDLQEIDQILGYVLTSAVQKLMPMPSASVIERALSGDEINCMADVLQHLSSPPRELLLKITELLQSAFDASAAIIVVEGTAVSTGDDCAPVLSATLKGFSDSTGSMGLGPMREGTYTPDDGDRLRQYAALIGQLLNAARTMRSWRQQALTDEVSGLPNRRQLHEQLHRILTQAAQRQLPVTVLLFDVDDFKTYNDRFGHAAGDEVIRLVGQLFRRQCRESDIVARIGGDEFAVVFWDPAGPREQGSQHPHSVLRILDRFRAILLKQRLSFESTESIKPTDSTGPTGTPEATESPGPTTVHGQITISGGLATFPWNADDASTLIAKADEALLVAKRSGKNRVFVVSDLQTKTKNATP